MLLKRTSLRSVPREFRLALEGGEPVRRELLPIFRLALADDDIQSVVDVLRSGQISRGPRATRFEAQFCREVGVAHGVAVSSGTAALHLALRALELPLGSEVILPALTFVATAFAVEYCGLTPRFAEIDPSTGNLNSQAVELAVTPRTRAVIAVHYAGQSCPMDRLSRLAEKQGLLLVEDAAHAVGALYEVPESERAASPEQQVGNCLFSDLTIFSFFATKNITGGEGGLITTKDGPMAERIRHWRAHGIVSSRECAPAPGRYDVLDLGYNYNLSNLNLALLEAQLPKLETFNKQRILRAGQLTEALEGLPGIRMLPVPRGPYHVFHLYTVVLDNSALRVSRDTIVDALLAEGIQVGVYYPPIHLFSYFRQRYGWRRGMLPVTESFTDNLLTLPMHPLLTPADIKDIAWAVKKVLTAYLK